VDGELTCDAACQPAAIDASPAGDGQHDEKGISISVPQPPR